MSEPEGQDLFAMLGDDVKLINTDSKKPLEVEESILAGSLFDDSEHPNQQKQWSPKVLCLLSLLILLIGGAGMSSLVYGLWVVKPDEEPQKIIPIEARSMSKEEIELVRSKEAILELRKVVAGYLQASSVEAKLAFVRHPERVQPFMEDWYQSRAHSMKVAELESMTTMVPKTIFGKSFWKIELPSDGLFKKQLWVESLEDGSFKVDWETDVFYNPWNWDRFLAEKPTVPVSLRVYASWNDLYVYQHRDDEKYQSFRLENKDSDQLVTAYMERDKKGCRDMLALMQSNAKNPADLRDEMGLPFLLTLHFDESPEGKKNLVIDKLESPSWLIFD
ncbi:hypothetical protein HW115_03785 [Verrucomicrobiaceae bacterium N1E253]|uniref:Uncharacterized protein n=1 Tax=Oceaniferula marina TaxID=2748318 RepID=A0A851GHV7_9BACT|nr:hypothetical protein [Oceaniferula marina]NWK54717.1 hypothetical protein [Oceaniferula marina]